MLYLPLVCADLSPKKLTERVGDFGFKNRCSEEAYGGGGGGARRRPSPS